MPEHPFFHTARASFSQPHDFTAMKCDLLGPIVDPDSRSGLQFSLQLAGTQGLSSLSASHEVLRSISFPRRCPKEQASAKSMCWQTFSQPQETSHEQMRG